MLGMNGEHCDDHTWDLSAIQVNGKLETRSGRVATRGCFPGRSSESRNLRRAWRSSRGHFYVGDTTSGRVEHIRADDISSCLVELACTATPLNEINILNIAHTHTWISTASDLPHFVMPMALRTFWPIPLTSDHPSIALSNMKGQRCEACVQHDSGAWTALTSVLDGSGATNIPRIRSQATKAKLEDALAATLPRSIE